MTTQPLSALTMLLSRHTRRREFITLLGGAAVSWPMAARAQQPDRMRRIGVFMHFASGDAEGQARIGAFLQGLQEFGWAIGSNVQIDYRWSAGDPERGRRDAAELLALSPDVILATGGATLGPLHQANPHRADRVHADPRSGRRRLC